MQVTYTDSGVDYTQNNKTLSFTGEQDAGEVHIDSTFYGYYERDEDDVTRITDAAGVVLHEIDSDEDSYEELAASVLV